MGLEEEDGGQVVLGSLVYLHFQGWFSLKKKEGEDEEEEEKEKEEK